MKRILALLLTLLILGLSACGAAPAPAFGDEASIRGRLEGERYRNTLLDLQISAPEGWRFCGEDSLAQANELSLTAFRETDPKELMEQKGQLTLLMLENEAKGVLSLSVQPQQQELAEYSDAELFQRLRDSIVKNRETVRFSGKQLAVQAYETHPMQLGGAVRTVLHIRLATTNNRGAVQYFSDEYLIWCRGNEAWLGLLSLAIQDDSDPQPVLDAIQAPR